MTNVGNSHLFFFQCDPGTGLKSFIHQLSQDPVKIMLIGGYCSAVSLPVASVAHYWNLIQVKIFQIQNTLKIINTLEKIFPIQNTLKMTAIEKIAEKCQ